MPGYRRGDEPSTLDSRLRDKQLPELAPVWREEIGPLPQGMTPVGLKPHPDGRRLPFQLSMLARFLFSCLVDADYRETEKFYAETAGESVDRSIAIPLSELKAKLDAHLAGKRKTDSDVNRLRGEVLDHVLGNTREAPGLFSLTVPTGGGKTLTSLAFALDHAVRHGLDRIVYAIPFTSVIDQTAGIFRQILGDPAVLEHHSAIEHRSGAKEEAFRDKNGKNKLRLAMEDWSAPIVATTNVQLFESLFSNRPSRCRKLHNLAKSVIVLDEAQTIPLHVLNPCVAAIDELARNYGTSVVLCTATQPALKAPAFSGGLENVRELAPDPRNLQRRLRRVTFRHAGEVVDDELVDALAGHQQALIIVNSRAHALALYRAAAATCLEGLVHLTTRMVPFDRQKVLKKVAKSLYDRAPCRLIATSLVEAGVDLDFPRVWRAEAGLDSVLQAAGRCNREGSRPTEASLVTIFRAPDWRPPPEIKSLSGDMGRIADRHPDLGSLDAIEDYFREVYWRVGAEALDREAVMSRFRGSGSETDFAFRTVAEKFRLIEDGMTPIIVVRDEVSRKAVEALRFAEKTGGIARTLQRYVVQVPPKARTALVANGRARFVAEERLGDQFAVLEDERLYRDDVGLVWEEVEELRPGDSIF